MVPWTGDNPSSLIGTGIVAEGVLAVSLGTSDTVFALHRRTGARLVARLSIADRRLHEPGVLPQRLAGARMDAPSNITSTGTRSRGCSRNLAGQ